MQPLQVAGTLTADVLVGNRVLNEVEFIVIESEGHSLLAGAGDSYCFRCVEAGTKQFNCSYLLMGKTGQPIF